MLSWGLKKSGGLHSTHVTWATGPMLPGAARVSATQQEKIQNNAGHCEQACCTGSHDKNYTKIL